MQPTCRSGQLWQVFNSLFPHPVPHPVPHLVPHLIPHLVPRLVEFLEAHRCQSTETHVAKKCLSMTCEETLLHHHASSLELDWKNALLGETDEHVYGRDRSRRNTAALQLAALQAVPGDL